jgi:hypothetical protein
MLARWSGLNPKPDPAAARPGDDLQGSSCTANNPDAPEPAWRAEFRRAYGLADGEVLKRVAAPFPACRTEYCRSLRWLHPGLEAGDATLDYRWDGTEVHLWGTGFAPGRPVGSSLSNVLHSVGIPHQDIEGDRGLLHQLIEGEFVVRAGAPPERLVPRLEQILRGELDLPARLTLTRAERDVIVVGGRCEPKPRASGGPDAIDLFAVAPRDDACAGGGSGTFDRFLESLGSYIGRQLVSEVADLPNGRVAWRYHNSTQVLPGPDPNQDAGGVLRNVAGQTGLTFRPEKRVVRVLLLEKEPVGEV